MIFQPGISLQPTGLAIEPENELLERTRQWLKTAPKDAGVGKYKKLGKVFPKDRDYDIGH